MWPACLYLMFVLYLASLGPVAWLYGHKHISGRTYDTIWKTVYFPLAWLEYESDFFDQPIGEAYTRYVDWFESL